VSDLHAVVLGFLQGFSEWLPISSTAHVAVALRLFGLEEAAGGGAAFTAVSQLGSVLAALIYFRRDIVDAFRKPAAGSGDGDTVDRRILGPVALGTLPVVVAGFALRHAIEGPMRSLTVIASSAITFAVILAWVESRAVRIRRIGSVAVMDGLLIGIGQMFSLLPGASRSGTTLTAALACGFERHAAARFSFLLSLPAITAAGLFELVRHRHDIFAPGMVRPVALATAVAFLVGWATIDLLLRFLRKHPTYVFVVYRVVLGAIILWMLGAGVLQP